MRNNPRHRNFRLFWTMNVKQVHKQIAIMFIALLTFGCSQQVEEEIISPVKWEDRETVLPDSLESGSTYLSIYSQIYSEKEHRTHDLTVTVSLRNTDHDQPVYLTAVDFYDTHGKLLRSYLSAPVYIEPMETVEVVIDEKDKSGGTGGNFIFDWEKESTATEPLFEAVMISTVGQQGLSFSTVGLRLK